MMTRARVVLALLLSACGAHAAQPGPTLPSAPTTTSTIAPSAFAPPAPRYLRLVAEARATPVDRAHALGSRPGVLTLESAPFHLLRAADLSTALELPWESGVRAFDPTTAAISDSRAYLAGESGLLILDLAHATFLPRVDFPAGAHIARVLETEGSVVVTTSTPGASTASLVGVSGAPLAIAWQQEIPFVWSLAAAAGGRAFVLRARGELVAIDARTGAELWHAALGCGAEVLVAASATRVAVWDGAHTATRVLDAADGRVVGSFGEGHVSALAVSASHVYSLERTTTQDPGFALSFVGASADDAAPRFRVPSGEVLAPDPGVVWPAIRVAPERVFVESPDATLSIHDPETGERLAARALGVSRGLAVLDDGAIVAADGSRGVTRFRLAPAASLDDAPIDVSGTIVWSGAPAVGARVRVGDALGVAGQDGSFHVQVRLRGETSVEASLAFDASPDPNCQPWATARTSLRLEDGEPPAAPLALELEQNECTCGM